MSTPEERHRRKAEREATEPRGPRSTPIRLFGISLFGLVLGIAYGWFNRYLLVFRPSRQDFELAIRDSGFVLAIWLVFLVGVALSYYFASKRSKLE
jgi:hypothetical protein